MKVKINEEEIAQSKLVVEVNVKNEVTLDNHDG